EALVRPDDAEAENRTPVVPPLGLAAKHRMGNDARVDVEVRKRLATVLAVYDDTVEAGEEVAPELLLPGCSAREQIVRSEHGRHTRPEQPRVELRHEPLHVHDVRAAPVERSDAEGMLDDL